MSGFKRTNRSFMEQWVVPGKDEELATGFLVNGTNAYNIEDKQLGVLSLDLNGTVRVGEFLSAGDTPAETKAIKIIQGTSASENLNTSDLWEVRDQDKIESGIIRAGFVRSVSSSEYDTGNYSVVSFGNFDNLEVNKNYNAVFRILSHKRDRDFGMNDDVITVNYSAKDITVAEEADYVLQNLVYSINQRSVFTNTGKANEYRGTKPIIAFGIKRSGGSGTAVGTIAIGTNISYQESNGNTSVYKANAPFVVALAKLVQNGSILATSTIEVVDLATAGAASLIDTFIVVSFDEREAAYFDDIVFVRTNLEGSLDLNPSEFYTSNINAVQEVNSGRQLLVAFRNRAGLNVHTMQNHPHGEWFSRGKEYIEESSRYNLNIIEYFEIEDTLTIESVTQSKVFIPTKVSINESQTVANIVTNLNANLNGYTVTSDVSDVVSDLNDILGPWLSAQSNIVYLGNSVENTPII
jgi:hypothetical protein